MKHSFRSGLAFAAFSALSISFVSADSMSIVPSDALLTGDTQCDGGTFHDTYYLGSQNHVLVDTFTSPSDDVYRFDYGASSLGIHDPANLMSFRWGSDAFYWRSNGKPHNIDTVLVASSTMDLANVLPTNYTRSDVAAQITYKIARTPYKYLPGSRNSLTFLDYDNISMGTKSYTYNTPWSSPSQVIDAECFNVHIAYCGDGVVDNSSLVHSVGTDWNIPLKGDEECDDGNNIDGDGCSSTCQIEEKFDLALTKTVDATASDLKAGGTVVFDINVINQGKQDATDVVVSDYIPTGLTLVEKDGWTKSGNKATTTVSSLNAGKTITKKVTFTIASDAPDSLTNAAEISSAKDKDGKAAVDCDDVPVYNTTNGDLGETITSGMVNDAVGGACDTIADNGTNGKLDADHHDIEIIKLTSSLTFDLALIKKVQGIPTLAPDSEIIFDIIITNQGTVNAKDITVVDYIPAGLTLKSTDWTQTWSKAIKTIASLDAGKSITVSIAFTIDKNATGTLKNFSEITSGTPVDINGDTITLSNGDTLTDCDSTSDTDNQNTSGETDANMVDNAIGGTCDELNKGDEDDHDISGITVGGTPDLVVAKEVNKNDVLDGDEVVFKITFSNEGSITGDLVDIVDTLPSGYVFKSAELTNYTGLPSDPQYTTGTDVNGYTTVTYSDLVLAPKQGGVILITATVDAEYCTQMTNVATIAMSPDSSIVEINLDNNQAEALAVCESTIKLDKTQKTKDISGYQDDPLKVSVGEAIEYKIVVNHTGSVSGTLKLIDTLPEYVEAPTNKVFKVAGQDKSSDCKYEVTTHTIVCEPFVLDGNEFAVLTFEAMVKSDTNAVNVIINTVSLFEDTIKKYTDTVTATTGETPGGEIKKEVSTSDVLKIGEDFSFNIKFANTGSLLSGTDIVRYNIIDRWPADQMALKCDGTLYSTATTIAWLDSCLKNNLQVNHSVNGTLSDVVISAVDGGTNNIFEIRLSFDVATNPAMLLKPGEYVEFDLDGQAIVSGTHTNKAEVKYWDENDASGEGDSDSTIVVEDGQCLSITAQGGSKLSYDKTTKKYSKEYTCKANGISKKITLNCGNGTDPVSKYDVDSLTATCEYGSEKEASHIVRCFYNDELHAQPDCTTDADVPPPPKLPICGDGVKDLYEVCDYAITDPSIDGYHKDCTDKCTIPDKTGIRFPDCMFPVDTAEKDSENDPIALSIMSDEILPFWWYIDPETKESSLTTDAECAAGDGEDKIINNKNTTCIFSVQKDGTPLIGTIEVDDCFNKDAWKNKSLFKYFTESKWNKMAIAADAIAKEYLKAGELKRYIKDGNIGEFQLILDSFKYQLCKNNEAVDKESLQCCAVNFTVSDPYVVQDSLSIGKDYNKKGGDINVLKKLTDLSGKPFINSDIYPIVYKPVTSGTYDGGPALKTAVGTFVDKYKALALGSSAGVKKVPGKNIFIVSDSFNAGTIATKMGSAPYTIIVDDGATVAINKDLTNNAMYIVRNGIIKVWAAVDEMSGIFILGDKGTMTADKIRNDDVDGDWNDKGQLVIKGLIAGGDISDLINKRRSTLRRWFLSKNKEKEAQKVFENGASLRIINNSKLWTSPPPGVDELDAVFAVYKN